MEKLIEIIFTALCISIPLGIIVLAAFFGTKARRKYADEIQNNIRKGHYSNWSKSPTSNRLRLIGVLQIINLIGILLILIVWITGPSPTMKVTLVFIAGVILVAIIVLGTVMTNLLRKK